MSYNGTTEGAVATYQCYGGYILYLVMLSVSVRVMATGMVKYHSAQRVSILLLIHLTVYTCTSLHIHLSILMEKSLNFVLFLQLHNYTSAIVANSYSLYSLNVYLLLRTCLNINGEVDCPSAA